MNLDGTGLIQLTSEPYNETSPAWIDSKVVYVSDKSGNKNIWSMDINGSNNKQLTNTAYDEDMPSWSYIGGIIYAEEDSASNLWAMNLDGTGKIKITNSTAYPGGPVFSQEYPGILYTSAANGERSLHLMDFVEKGHKVKFWELEEGYSIQAIQVDMKSITAWLNFRKDGVTKDDSIVPKDQTFSLYDTGKVILNAILKNITVSDNYFEAELVNVTQYSSVDGSPLQKNMNKILVNKIILNKSIPKRGDFNGNDIVDIGDVARVAYMVVGREPQDLRADFNNNGRVDIGDAAKIAYYLVGKINEL